MTSSDKLTKEEKRLEAFASFFGKKGGWKIEGSPVVNLTPVKGGEARRILPGTPEWEKLRREARDCPWESYLNRS